MAGAEGVDLDVSASIACIEQEAIRKAEEKAEARAKRIMDDARSEIAALMLAAREEAEEERHRACQEGFSEGAEESKRICDERYAEKMREDDEMLRRVIEEIYTEKNRIYEELEDEVIRLTFEIVRKVIGSTEESVGGVFQSMIKNALRQITPEGKIIIRVSPAEYERFFSSGSAVFELDKGVSVTAGILRDASLGDFDCVIDTEDETVNAGLETQLKYIEIAFNRADD